MEVSLFALLVVVPGALLLLSARKPSAASLRRLSVSVLVDGAELSGAAEVGARIRRRRVFGAVGAVLGLWSTAAWQNAEFTWGGLLHAVSPGGPIGFGGGSLVFAGHSFILVVNFFGILTGFAAGLALSEWTGRRVTIADRRSALLAPRAASRYLPGWAGPVVGGAATAAVVALGVSAVIPESLKLHIPGYAVGTTSHWWWAVVLLGVGVVALGTRSFVLAFAPHAATDAALAARETTRALTAATLTIVALAAFAASVGSTMTRMSSWFSYSWGDVTATTGIAVTLLAEGLVVAAFCTPYWMLALERGPGQPSEPVAIAPHAPIPS